MNTKSTLRIEGGVAYIPLTNGCEAVIDAEDVPLVEGFNWHALVGNNTVYATRKKPNGAGETEYLHRIITNAPDGKDVDHIDHDGLNNRKANLRVCLRSENLWNKKMSKYSTSGYKGVGWHKASSSWQARLCVNGTRKHLGLFATSEDAHIVHQKACEKYHGEYRYSGED